MNHTEKMVILGYNLLNGKEPPMAGEGNGVMWVHCGSKGLNYFSQVPVL